MSDYNLTNTSTFGGAYHNYITSIAHILHTTVYHVL